MGETKNYREFLFQCWTRCNPGILGNVLLVVSHGDVCHSIVVNDAVVVVTEVPDLFSDHEIEDTQLLLHAHQAVVVVFHDQVRCQIIQSS